MFVGVRVWCCVQKSRREHAARIKRVCPSWVHGRLLIGSEKDLTERSSILNGCGELGEWWGGE